MDSKNQLKRYRIEDSRGWQNLETERADGSWVKYKDAMEEIERLRAALELVVKTSEHYDLGAAYTAARHLDAVRTARNALEPIETKEI